MSKIVLVGAGSAVFTQGLVVDLIRDTSETWELALVDTNAGTLETVTKLVGKMISASGASISLSSATDRRDVLPGADVVVSTIGVGGRRGWEHDVLIPRRYGIYQPVGDSVMVGGISRAMRMIPALVGLAEDISTFCPRALFCNYANPMAINCTAIRRATDVPVIGLCHGVPDSVRSLSRRLGVDPARVSAAAVGINHLTFVYDLRFDGEDLLPALRDEVQRRRFAGLDPSRVGALAFRDGGEEVDPFSWSLFEVFGAYPVPGDRHVTEFFADAFPDGRYFGKLFGVDAFSFEGIIDAGDETFARMQHLARSAQPLDDTFFERFAGEHEQLVEILHAIRADTRRDAASESSPSDTGAGPGPVFSANLPNGPYSNLPAGAVLEMPTRPAGGTLVAVERDDVPDRLVPIIERHVGIIETTVEAALTGSRTLMIDAMLASLSTLERSGAAEMADELLAAHAADLPQFA